MGGAFRIAYRQFDQISHRRKLSVFLILFPVFLMVLFGIAIGDQRIPVDVHPEDVRAALAVLKDDPSVSKALAILRNDTQSTDVRLLVGSFKAPDGEMGHIFVLPGENTTAGVAITERVFYYFKMPNDPFSGPPTWGAGDPSLIESNPEFSERTNVDLQPLYTSEFARKMASAMLGLAKLGLRLFLSEDRRLIDVIFPEVVGIQIMWAGVLGASVMAVEDRIAGARRRILMSPISAASYLTGTALASFVLISGELVILFAIAFGVFGVTILGSLVDLAIVMASASFSMIGLGMIVSHFSKTADETFYLATLINLPMTFLSSRVLPISQAPASQILSNILPMTHANLAMNQIAVFGAPLASVLPQVYTLLGIGLVLYVLGAILISRER